MRDINDAVDREFACDHDESRLVFKDTVTGVRQYLRQCLGCGKRLTQFLRYADLDPDEMENTAPFDDEIGAEWSRRRSERYAELHRAARDVEQADWFARYNQYLATPKWQAKRLAVLARDNHTCQACLSRRAAQVHHLTYDHVFDEPLFELTSVCLPCHAKLHNKPMAICA